MSQALGIHPKLMIGHCRLQEKIALRLASISFAEPVFPIPPDVLWTPCLGAKKGSSIALICSIASVLVDLRVMPLEPLVGASVLFLPLSMASEAKFVKLPMVVEWGWP